VTGASGAALEVIARAAAAKSAPLYVDDPRDPLFFLPSGRDAAAPPLTTRLANARLAAAGLRLLGVEEAAVGAAVVAPALPGRGETFLHDGRHVLLDGAHDPAAAARLAEELAPGYVLLFGSLAKKQGRATLAVLAQRAQAVVITEAQAGEGLAAFDQTGHRLVADPAAALELALELAGTGGRVVIAGSLYLAGRLRPLLHSRTA
jgi:dihydrofolate synthase/folylpolyglutamate synthase